jgi:hypothetical protein
MLSRRRPYASRSTGARDLEISDDRLGRAIGHQHRLADQVLVALHDERPE